MSDGWYYAQDGRSVGPLSIEEMGHALRCFHRPLGVLIWRQGMANWTLAGDVKELLHLFDTPPPLPSTTGPAPISGSSFPRVMPEAKEGPSRGAADYGADLFSQFRQVTPNTIVLTKLAAFIIAIGVIYFLVEHYRFEGVWEWGAIALGIVAYVLAKVVISILVGYWWGRQDAKNLKRFLDQRKM